MPSSDYARMKKPSISSYQKEQLKDGYITAQKTKLTSAQKDSQISIFVAVMGKYNVGLGFFLVSSIFCKYVLCMDHVGACLNYKFIIQFASY